MSLPPISSCHQSVRDVGPACRDDDRVEWSIFRLASSAIAEANLDIEYVRFDQVGSRPEQNRPKGYLPADDDPASDRDVEGENLNDLDCGILGNAVTMKQDQPDEFPPFDDPAHSNSHADTPVQKDAPETPVPPHDPEYAGHPDFWQDAAANKPPEAIGNSEPIEGDR